MERERLTRLVQDAAAVDRGELGELQALAKRFPWVAGAQVLRSVGVQKAGEVLAEEVVRTAAAHVPSRTALFDHEGGRTAYLITRGGGRKAAPKVNVTLDMRGATCPGPILEAKKVLDGMQSGEMLMLVSNCPGTPADVDAWVNNTPLELVDRVEIARGAFEFYLRKK